jgi:ribonuclease HII
MADIRDADRAFLQQHSLDYLIGVDEAGRGPLAGPVVASAVALSFEDYNLEMNSTSPLRFIGDSKKVTPKRREAIVEELQRNPLGIVGTHSISASMIDSINILEATKLAWQEAVEQCLSLIPPEASVGILIDGNIGYHDDLYMVKPVIKGDSLYWSIALASIIAKVTRDRWMQEQSASFPEYDLGQHKGYGTRRHIEAIRNHGLTPLHRKTFCKNFL